MGSAVRIGTIWISLAGLAHADLDFTPRVEEYELDGVKRQQVVFSDGGRRVIYAPPPKWEYSGGGNRFVLHPRFGSGSAEASISVHKVSQPEPFDETGAKRLCDEVLSSVPRGATNVTLVSQQLSPLLIERKETFLVVINYEYYSDAYTKSVMFLNRQNEQVRFELICSRAAFHNLQKAFLSSHYTWQNL